MNEEREIIMISLKKDTVSKLNEIKHFCTFKSRHSNYTLPKTVEDVIITAIAYFLNSIEKNEIENRISLDSDLGKPFQLKNKFKEILKKKGLKQKELAEITNIDTSNLSLILNNKTQPSLDYFIRIWVALGALPIEDVLYREIEEK